MASKTNKNDPITVFVIMGASGDLSKKKIYPTLWSLYRQSYIPRNTLFIGYARSKIVVKNVVDSFTPHLEVTNTLLEYFNCMKDADKEENKEAFNAFIKQNHYISGLYDEPSGFTKLNELINKLTNGGNANRIFYLALPPSVFKPVVSMIHLCCWVKGDEHWGRLIIEKPFGHDLASSNELSSHIGSLFTESQVYRIDHYLGKEMVKNILVLRFGNMLFRPIWNRNFVSSIQISFKEPFGVEGRGGYFDDAGIIRDIIQNHLLQILSIIAMDKPLTISAQDIRGEKLKILRAIQPLTLDNLVIGQYVKDPTSNDPRKQLSYKDVEGVPKDSITPTYACAVLYINNEVWEGVPFILRCGKALNERKAEIRVQLKSMPGDIFAPGQLKHNELVIRVQPGEAVYVKMMTKKPGSKSTRSDSNSSGTGGDTGNLPDNGNMIDVEETELELTYNERYQHVRVPDAYENLILDVFNGLQMDFVHMDELREAWRIVDGALKKLVSDKVEPFPYVFGSRNGPGQADELIKQKGFVYSGTYVYPGKGASLPGKL